jgi:hypothetical protein
MPNTNELVINNDAIYDARLQLNESNFNNDLDIEKVSI